MDLLDVNCSPSGVAVHIELQCICEKNRPTPPTHSPKKHILGNLKELIFHPRLCIASSVSIPSIMELMTMMIPMPFLTSAGTSWVWRSSCCCSLSLVEFINLPIFPGLIIRVERGFINDVSCPTVQRVFCTECAQRTAKPLKEVIFHHCLPQTSVPGDLIFRLTPQAKETRTAREQPTNMK